MWKKPESDYPQPETQAPKAPAPVPPRTNPVEPRREASAAVIGPSITIHGDLSGEEDLLIQGRVEGKVDLKQNNITVGRNGHVKADMFGRIISIEGDVEGNLFGGEQVVLRQSGSVRGNITAPRVSLEDGSKFKGSIDMEPRAADKPRTAGPEVKPRMDTASRAAEAEPRAQTAQRPEPTVSRT
jgi:cytoskeletal protein CcmA (bactofilin family)